MLDMFFQGGEFCRIQIAINEGSDLFSFAIWGTGRHGYWQLNSRNASVQELLAHHVASPEQAILDCAERQAGDFDDFFVSKVLRVAQYNEFAVSSGKRPDD